MKKIREDTLIKMMLIITVGFAVLCIVSYVLLKHFLLETLSQTSLHSASILVEYNLVWLNIFALFLLLIFFTLYLLKKINTKINEDIDAIDDYVKEISEHKNYVAVLHIKHYLEFLEIAVVLKNIAKRLNQKEKNPSKK